MPLRRTLAAIGLRGALSGAVAFLVASAPAAAHGPCGCLVPALGEHGGARVKIVRTPAHKVIFNPRPEQYGAAMVATGYASAYRPGSPTETLLSLPVSRARRNVMVPTPDVPPGVYVVLILDGTEGGEHKTWDYFQVLGPPPSRGASGSRASVDVPPASRAEPAPTAGRDENNPLIALAMGLVGGAVITLCAVAARTRRSAQAAAASEDRSEPSH